jgi:hypothetical protein
VTLNAASGVNSKVVVELHNLFTLTREHGEFARKIESRSGKSFEATSLRGSTPVVVWDEVVPLTPCTRVSVARALMTGWVEMCEDVAVSRTCAVLSLTVLEIRDVVVVDNLFVIVGLCGREPGGTFASVSARRGCQADL